MMIKVRVTNKNNYTYRLDQDGIIYVKSMEFTDLDVEPGDYIYLDESILKENNIYTFGKVINEPNEKDLIKIIKNNKEIVMQRYYG